MKWQQTLRPLRKQLSESRDCTRRFLCDAQNYVSLEQVISGTSLGGRAQELSGKSVLVMTRDQLAAALVMIELDGVARRLVLCPPAIPSEHLRAIACNAAVDAIVTDAATPCHRSFDIAREFVVDSLIKPNKGGVGLEAYRSEWVLLTSGTSGFPKLVVHNLSSLSSPIKTLPGQESNFVWGTFYDIRRYGGLQIFLRALLGGGSLVLSEGGEPATEHLHRLASRSVTHLNGTPSQWRRALMSASARGIAPRYIRLSGEIVDQPILRTLRSFYPHSTIAHTFASTEAGSVFEVTDELEGFPASFADVHGEVEMKVEDSSLCVRSPRTALDYLGEHAGTLKDGAGFIDTGDIVERRDGRYYFLGRRSGVINVGGLKVYPEEVEAQINRHPAVRMSCVRPRRSSITGSIVVADIVLCEEREGPMAALAELEQDILRVCRKSLPRHKVPVKLQFVSHLSVTATGKMARSDG